MYKMKFKGVFILFLTALLSLSITGLQDHAQAQILNTEVNTDTESHVLIGYWDLRDRDSYFQVTNTTGEAQRVHIQLYDAGNDCIEFNYYDTLTPRDTHVYNVNDLDRNNGVELAAPDLSGGHGIVAVTHVDGTDALDLAPVLTGNFRINDNNGYRYQTNFAGVNEFGGSPTDESYKVNFNNIDSSTFSDLVVINAAITDNPGGVVVVPDVYEVTLYDENENPISCSPVLLGCFSDIEVLSLFDAFSETYVNVGVNQAVTNSRGGPSLCLGNDTTGYLELDPSSTLNGSGAEIEVIFMGLNNGNGTGSMDTAVEINEDLPF